MKTVKGTQVADVLSLVALDAWRLFEWLELVDINGLTDTGHYISMGAGEYPDNTSWEHGIAEALRGKIRKCYLGLEGLVLADFAQDGAENLYQSKSHWVQSCPGLLLVELEALLYTATTDKGKAETLLTSLVGNRREAMRANPELMSEIEEPDLVYRRALAVSQFYREELPNLTNPAVLTETAVRSTAKLFEAAWLLEARTTDCELVEYWESTPE